MWLQWPDTFVLMQVLVPYLAWISRFLTPFLCPHMHSCGCSIIFIIYWDTALVQLNEPKVWRQDIVSSNFFPDTLSGRLLTDGVASIVAYVCVCECSYHSLFSCVLDRSWQWTWLSCIYLQYAEVYTWMYIWAPNSFSKLWTISECKTSRTMTDCTTVNGAKVQEQGMIT